ncbi:MAG: 30S ribosomal protein S3 [Candidatus Micrarchaeia archaeon]
MAVERKFIEDSILRFRIAEFMKEQLERAGFSNLTIQKTPLLTLINAEVTNPGKVIGRKGKTINEITDKLKTEFHLENPKINITVVNNPDLEPQVVARRLVKLIEMGKNPRRMMHSMVKSIMDAGAVGCEIVIGGKLAAKGGRAKSFRVIAGYLPKSGEPARWVKVAKVTAYPKPGAIGVQVRIAPPNVQFPDKKAEVELPAVIRASEKFVDKESGVAPVAVPPVAEAVALESVEEAATPAKEEGGAEVKKAPKPKKEKKPAKKGE